MSRIRTLFLYLSFFFMGGVVTLLLFPLWQTGSNIQTEDSATGDLVPPALSGSAQRGQALYISLGCNACHTQAVQSKKHSNDLARQWGTRRSVARDYLTQSAAPLGTLRVGPDLSNIGKRQNSAAWHHQHLYAPTSTTPNSIMPAYPFLYEVRTIRGEPSLNRLNLSAPFAPAEGKEIVPTPDAQALVSYLLSLQQNYELPEAPIED